jgi:hypothetical protein
MQLAVEHPDGFERLRAVVKQRLNEGARTEGLLEGLGRVRGLVSTGDEDKVLDVMDLLVGWCAPEFRLVPPELAARPARGPHCEDEGLPHDDD